MPVDNEVLVFKISQQALLQAVLLGVQRIPVPNLGACICEAQTFNTPFHFTIRVKVLKTAFPNGSC